ncbi:MAG: response regulator [Chloroflexi bacterium]|nr:response regulator [Chloroflexota bacterium]
MQQTAVTLDQAVNPLAIRLGWQIQSQSETNSDSTRLILPLHDPIVLVIDDNQGLVELLERYLSGHDCRVIAANSGQAGLDRVYPGWC